MQGEQLKGIRKTLGWSQDQMADALGLSRVFIGLMERDAKPIERRTELAVRYIEEHPERFERDDA